MDKKDLRTEKTKESIQKAVIDLFIHTSSSDISVTAVCKEARIARSTFYDHYSNISQCLNEIAEGVLGLLEDDIKKEKKIDRSRFMELYFHKAKSDPRRFYVLCHTSPDGVFARGMEQLYFQYVSEKKMNPYWVYYRIYGVVGITIRWIQDDCRTSISELIQSMFS